MTQAIDDTQGFSIFCDDIREEINAKTTLVGLYTGEMYIASEGPVVIPQLFYMGKVIFNPANLPSTVSLALRKYSVTGEMEEMGQIDLPPIAEIAFPSHPLSYGPGQRMLQVNAAMRMSPLQVDADFTIRSFMIVDGSEKPIGSISIKLVDSLP